MSNGRDDRNKRPWFPLVLILLAVLILLVVIGWWRFHESILLFDAQDAVHVIACEADRLYANNPNVTQKDIDHMVWNLHKASVINLAIDSGGKAVDPFGTGFRIGHQDLPEKSRTTAMSAGPDRRFGTEDDIRFVYEREKEPRQNHEAIHPATSSDTDSIGNQGK